MVVSKSVVSDYDLMKPDGSGAKLRYGNNNSVSKSPGRYGNNNSVSKSPGAGISKRTWSPGQAVLFKRKKVEGESTLSDSFDALTLSNLHDHIEYDNEEEDYLTQTLLSSTKGVKRSGRRPTKSTSMMGSTTKGYQSRPMKSKSMSSSLELPPLSTLRKPSLTETMMIDSTDKVRYNPSGSYCSNSSGETSLETSFSSRSKSPPKPRNKSRGRASRSKSPAAHDYKNRSMSKNRSKPSNRSRTKSRDRSAPVMNQSDLPIEIQKKLYRITDPNITIKKKVELELEFTRGTPEERRIYLEFRNRFDRKEFLNWKALDEQQKLENIKAKAREESLKEAAFQRSVERKRQMERKKKEEAKDRERRAEEQARLHSVKTIANAMTEIKNSALEAATFSVARNQFEKKRYEDEIKQRVEHFRRNEGREMTDVQRALKEALIEQEDPEEKRMRLGPSRRR